jgi:hypothetical protein
MSQKHVSSAWLLPDGPSFEECIFDPACDHEFSGWRNFMPPRHGGEKVCVKCGMGAQAYSLRKASTINDMSITITTEAEAAQQYRLSVQMVTSMFRRCCDAIDKLTQGNHMRLLKRLSDWLTLRDYEMAKREWHNRFYYDRDRLVAAQEGADRALKRLNRMRAKAERKGLI